jgi:hypothetical protein
MNITVCASRCRDTWSERTWRPAAPIFELADYGMVGDLFSVVPRLTAEIERHYQAS